MDSNVDITPGTREHPKEFGLFDVKDKSWIGTQDAALTYGDRVIAQIAAQVMCERLRFPMGRIQVEPFTGADVKGEDLHPIVSAEEALSNLCKENV